MTDVLDVIWHGLRDSLLMAWEVWWALVLGFAISGIVQAWVPRERIESALSGSGPKPVALATGLGAASSSCSYAAIAIAKSLFQKGASATTALAFQFSSTNLVWELGLVLWVLLGWQFTLAEYVGGIVMIVLMAVLLRVFVSPRLEAQAREHAQLADAGHQHHMAGEQLSWRQRLTSVSAWSDVARNFRGDWQMLYKEITVGFLLAGFIAQLGNGFFNGLFLRHTGGVLSAVENVIVGPIIAVLSFVCSVGNVPLAAVLWSGGISFAGVLAFLFADLIVLPIIAIYRKYYGTRFTLRIVALMFVTMVIAALIVDGVFSALGLIPTGPRPSRADIFGTITVNYKLFLNILGVAIFTALFWLTARRGASDSVCGMTVDRAQAITKQSSAERYVPAAGRAWLTALYDPAMALTMRERSFRPVLVAVALADRPRVLLDVGCGTGTLAAQLAQAEPSVYVHGIDGDQAVLARAHEKARSFGERVRFSQGQAEALPVADATVDVVVASLLLHHLTAAAKHRSLMEARRVLQPGGRLVITDWGRPHDPLMRAAFFGLQLLDGYPNTRDHAAGRLPSLVAQAGFSAVMVRQRWRTLWGSLEIITARAGPT